MARAGGRNRILHRGWEVLPQKTDFHGSLSRVGTSPFLVSPKRLRFCYGAIENYWTRRLLESYTGPQGSPEGLSSTPWKGGIAQCRSCQFLGSVGQSTGCVRERLVVRLDDGNGPKRFSDPRRGRESVGEGGVSFRKAPDTPLKGLSLTFLAETPN